MTDQPTDHRAEAEQWLARTERLVGPDEDDETMTIMLSFAHWLGAIHDALLALGQQGTRAPVEMRIHDDRLTYGKPASSGPLDLDEVAYRPGEVVDIPPLSPSEG